MLAPVYLLRGSTDNPFPHQRKGIGKIHSYNDSSTVLSALQRIFITGASGCVGHYVLNHLISQPLIMARRPRLNPAPDGGVAVQLPETLSQHRIEPPYHLYILVRDRRKLRWSQPQQAALESSGGKLTLIEGDLDQIAAHGEILQQMDALIHLAAAWGDAETAHRINVTRTLELLQLLNPERCRKILYFSTASLLDPDNHPLPVAGRAGTAYIRSKYEMLMRRQELPLQDRLITLYPTLLFGGSSQHPHSHITAGLADVVRWLSLVRFLRLDASFHFIHAEDIAQIVAHLLLHPIPQSDLVLGNPALTFDQCVEQMCHFYGKRIFFRLPISIPWVNSIAFLWRVRLSEWDQYCLHHRHFTYQTVNAETFGLSSHFPTIDTLLTAYAWDPQGQTRSPRATHNRAKRSIRS